MNLFRRAASSIVVASMAFVTVASAGTREGVTMPDSVQVSGDSLQLNGMGVRKATMFNVKVYVAGLYLEQPSMNARTVITSPQSKVLTLKFVRDVDRGDIVDAWTEGFSKNNDAATVKRIKPQINQLNSWMRGMKEGDTMVFTYVPGSGVQVMVGNRIRGNIAGDEFARGLFSIWLGPNPPNSDLKAGLLGRK